MIFLCQRLGQCHTPLVPQGWVTSEIHKIFCTMICFTAEWTDEINIWIVSKWNNIGACFHLINTLGWKLFKKVFIVKNVLKSWMIVENQFLVY